MAGQSQVIQLVMVPHRPVHTDEEINKDLAPAFDIIQKSVLNGREASTRLLIRDSQGKGTTSSMEREKA